MNIFLDACILIYWIELKEPYYNNFIDELSKINKKYPQNMLFTSRLSYLECLIKPIKEKDKFLVKQYEDLFYSDRINVIDITESIIRLATQLRVKYNLKTPDAIQIASAISLNEPPIFISNDKSFRKIKEIDIKIIDIV